MSKLYAPPENFLWDFWIFEENGLYHLYHLQAPLTAGPRLRHRQSSIGYAVSQDLTEWTNLGTVLAAGDEPADWDSVSIWTGCTIKKDDTYYMFYTSRCRMDQLADGYVGHTQRIGVATSKDLKNWHKYQGNPVVTVDCRYYEKQPDAFNRHEGCRDPFVVYDPVGRWYYMFFTARDREGDPLARGCIGRARSRDLLNWEMMPPAASPHIFTDMEVPSLHWHDGLWYMLVAVKQDWYSEDYKRAIYPEQPQTGVLYLVAESLEDEFRLLEPHPVVTGTQAGLYTGRIITGPQGNHVFLSWHAGIDEGRADAETPYRLSKCYKVAYDTGKRLRVECN